MNSANLVKSSLPIIRWPKQLNLKKTIKNMRYEHSLSIKKKKMKENSIGATGRGGGGGEGKFCEGGGKRGE